VTVLAPRRLAAEFVGTGLLVAAVVGSGIAASRLSSGDAGLQLLENAFATALALAVLILIFGPVSGGHLNPVVSAADWWLGRRAGTGLAPRDLVGYVLAQAAGAVAGAVLADLMYALPAVTWSATRRDAPHLWLGEVVATAGLVLLVFALARSGRATVAPAAVGGYIGAAYWFTSSTSFANPAVTLGRAFSDTFAGIAPGSVPAFVAAQVAGGLVGVALLAALYPSAGQAAGAVVVPHRTGLQEPMTMPDKPSVLFVCVHNAGRSQMAAGWLRHLAGDSVEVRSAGSEPADRINPVAVEAMREVGIDIAAGLPRKLDRDTVAASDVVVTMGCGDTCPVFPGKRYEDWVLEDPAGQPLDAVRRIRDDIRARVGTLLAQLQPTGG
jgi:arsenate reductase